MIAMHTYFRRCCQSYDSGVWFSLRSEFFSVLQSGIIRILLMLYRTTIQATKSRRRAIVVVTDPVQAIIVGLICRRSATVRYVQANDLTLFEGRLPARVNAMYAGLTTRFLRRYRNVVFNSSTTAHEVITAIGRAVTFEVINPPIRDVFFHHVIPKPARYPSAQVGLVLRKAVGKRADLAVRLLRALARDETLRVQPVVLDPDGILGSEETDVLRLPGGTPDEVAQFYRRLDVFVSLSDAEGLGLPPIEAMAAGCPVVMTEVAGHISFGVDGENCLFVPGGAVEHAYAAVKHVLTDRVLRERLVVGGLATAAEFTADRSAEKFCEYITSHVSLR